MVARCFYKVLRRLFFNTRLRGVANLSADGPVIMVANHVGSFGPVSLITSMPKRMYPWVAHEVTEPATVARRIQVEFVEQELHLKAPLSVWLGRAIGRICVALMKDIGAIPVYQQSRMIRTTLERSIALLEQGKTILVFAEDSSRKINDAVCELCTGFIHVARLYYERTARAIQFIPVAVNKSVGAIKIGRPIPFHGERPFAQEKKRVKDEVQNKVVALYYELEHAV